MIGKIVKQISNDYTVLIDGKKIICKARGKFRNLKETPLVGDNVRIDLDKRYILEILPRKNELIRPSVANIDMAIIVTSVKEPDLDLILLDKLLCVVSYNKIKPIICFAKLDLLDKDELKEFNKYRKYYDKYYDTYLNTEINKIKPLFKDKIVVLTGQSGAGKSSLLNRIDSSLDLKVDAISLALNRGKHTTRHTELLSINDGLIADTPGFSSLDLNNMSKEDIKNCFVEFSKYNCEYKNCMHDKEAICEVKKVVGKDILISRYNNYIKLIRR